MIISEKEKARYQICTLHLQIVLKKIPRKKSRAFKTVIMIIVEMKIRFLEKIIKENKKFKQKKKKKLKYLKKLILNEETIVPI